MNGYDVLESGYRIVILFRNGKCVVFGEKCPNYETAMEIAKAVETGEIPMLDGKGKEIKQKFVAKVLVFEEITISRCVYPNSEEVKGEIGFLALRRKSESSGAAMRGLRQALPSRL
jgi:hypothetical protein